MRLCILGDAGSIHVQRWVGALSERGHQVTVLSLRTAELSPVPVRHLPTPAALGKLGYLTVTRRVRSLLRELRPDLLHAHYATSYGLLAARSGFHPLLTSVWGTDVYEFPRRSRLHGALLRYNLRHADLVASTSHAMADEARRYTAGEVHVTPFGVDIERFAPPPNGAGTPGEVVTIGLVKALEEKYGVDVLIDAFDILAARHPHLRLLIVGDGSQWSALRSKVERSPHGARVRLLPAVRHGEVPGLLHSMDIFAVPSVADSESFCVAAVEAAACGLPVVASRVGGLPEVVRHGETGILVAPGDPAALAGALEGLICSVELRRRLGRGGRAFVERTYDWEASVETMEGLYRRLVAAAGGAG